MPRFLRRRQILGLLRRGRARDQPGPKVLLERLLAALDLNDAQGGPDEVDQVPAGLPIGAAQVLLVEVVLGRLSRRASASSSSRSGARRLESSAAALIGGTAPDRLLPVGHVVLLVDAFAVGADLDVGHRFEPLVLEAELHEFTRRLGGGRRCHGACRRPCR